MDRLDREPNPVVTADQKSSLLDWLPGHIQEAIASYGAATDISPLAVIEYAVSAFLALDTESTQAAPGEPVTLLAELPIPLQNRLSQYALLYGMPVEFVVELAIAFFLDPDAMTFDDCQIGVRQEQVESLKLNRDALKVAPLRIITPPGNTSHT